MSSINASSVFAIITSLKCGHCKKFRGNGDIEENDKKGETIRIYGNNGKGWRWDVEFFTSILKSSNAVAVIYDIVFMDFSPKRYFSIYKYALRTEKSKMMITKEEITDENIIGNVPPASIFANYIEKYPCFLFVNGNVWNHFSSLDSWREYESLFANEETIQLKYNGSPMYAVAPITNTTPTVLKGYGPKGIFCFGYLERYKDDFRVTEKIDIVEEFRKFSRLSPKEQAFPFQHKGSDEQQPEIVVPSHTSLAITEWTSPSKPFYFIDATSHFDTQTFLYSSGEYRVR